MSVSEEHIGFPGFKDATDLAPGEAQLHEMEWAPGQRGPYAVFGCPRGRGTCGVPVQPSPPNARGCSWQLVEGDETHVTISPSVNCDRGCGWHGFVKNGRAE